MEIIMQQLPLKMNHDKIFQEKVAKKERKTFHQLNNILLNKLDNYYSIYILSNDLFNHNILIRYNNE